MRIVQGDDGKFRITHQGRVVIGLASGVDTAGPFETEAQAEAWADMWIDDQVFDSDNEFSPELAYV